MRCDVFSPDAFPDDFLDAFAQSRTFNLSVAPLTTVLPQPLHLSCLLNINNFSRKLLLTIRIFRSVGANTVRFYSSVMKHVDEIRDETL